MEAVNLDGIRMDIFREIIKLAEEGLRDVYKYVKAEENEVLKDLLYSSVEEALKMLKEGKMCSTEMAMAKSDQAMQWK